MTVKNKKKIPMKIIPKKTASKKPSPKKTTRKKNSPSVYRGEDAFTPSPIQDI